MEILGLVIPLAILTLLLASWAHLAEDRRTLATLLYVVFGALSAVLILSGTVSALLVDELQRELDGQAFSGQDGLFMVALGIGVGVPLLPPFRTLVARLLPINEKSIPDMVGLSVMLGTVVLMVWTINLGTSEEDLGPVGSADLILQAVLLLIIAYFGIGGSISRGLPSVRERLGLEMPTARQVVISIALIIPIFLVSGIGGALTELLQPEYLEEIDDVMDEVTGNVTNVQGALLLGITAGVGEEILFRGAIQPRYGLIFTSLLFTLIHVQYGFSFVLVGVFFTALILGIQRRKMNTTSCIITHAAYNFAAVMMTSFA